MIKQVEVLSSCSVRPVSRAAHVGEEQLSLEVSEMEKVRETTVAEQGAALSPSWLACLAGVRFSIHSQAGPHVTWPHAHPRALPH